MTLVQKREARFLDALYLGVRDRAEFDASLNLLGGLFDVATAVLVDFDAARPEVSAQASVGLFKGEVLERYQRDFATLDPAPRAFMAVPPGTAIPTYRLLPEETRRPGVFFNEFFRPLGLEECLGGTLASTKGRFAMVGLQRPRDRKPFDDDDITRLEALMPHLARALQLRRAFLELEGAAGAMSEMCDRLAAGVVALDEDGRSLFVNAAARAMANANDGLSIGRGGRLLALNREANTRLAELESDVRSGGAGGILRAARAAGRPPYAIMVAPFLLDHGVDATRSRPRGVMFVVHDPLLQARSDALTISALFGLPNGTAQLVAAIAANEDLQAYADRTGISMNTVRYHLKAAYARTGVGRQSELVRLVSTALRDLIDHRDDGASG
ncbi:helix-turn-helix transcriptional regulator [Mesorhizobium sp.]|uniref:helix-turn-helix transcriptional regulator n=1 Tax=Mesorhizobium sp. TaxID=1871066 RepID=UPI0035658238